MCPWERWYASCLTTGRRTTEKETRVLNRGSCNTVIRASDQCYRGCRFDFCLGLISFPVDLLPCAKKLTGVSEELSVIKGSLANSRIGMQVGYSLRMVCSLYSRQPWNKANGHIKRVSCTWDFHWLVNRSVYAFHHSATMSLFNNLNSISIQ